MDTNNMNSIIQDAVMNSEVFDDLYMSEEEEDKLQDQSDIWLPDKIRKARSRNAHFTLQDRQNSLFWKKYVNPRTVLQHVPLAIPC